MMLTSCLPKNDAWGTNLSDLRHDQLPSPFAGLAVDAAIHFVDDGTPHFGVVIHSKGVEYSTSPWKWMLIVVRSTFLQYINGVPRHRWNDLLTCFHRSLIISPCTSCSSTNIVVQTRSHVPASRFETESPSLR
ncbi:hypothetical protein B5807_10522 [Epicoccum nigrum]|uniref:Uncharacterized protein n=1 Tax=Epicoccum nigrum TaxID=105696 RepID=A0A1Y2LP27_EPING|nr:hypothetical protein B5807_10522 [Epicoccum nigrum]